MMCATTKDDIDVCEWAQLDPRNEMLKFVIRLKPKPGCKSIKMLKSPEDNYQTQCIIYSIEDTLNGFSIITTDSFAHFKKISTNELQFTKLGINAVMKEGWRIQLDDILQQGHNFSESREMTAFEKELLKRDCLVDRRSGVSSRNGKSFQCSRSIRGKKSAGSYYGHRKHQDGSRMQQKSLGNRWDISIIWADAIERYWTEILKNPIDPKSLNHPLKSEIDGCDLKNDIFRGIYMGDRGLMSCSVVLKGRHPESPLKHVIPKVKKGKTSYHLKNINGFTTALDAAIWLERSLRELGEAPMNEIAYKLMLELDEENQDNDNADSFKATDKQPEDVPADPSASCNDIWTPEDDHGETDHSEEYDDWDDSGDDLSFDFSDDAISFKDDHPVHPTADSPISGFSSEMPHENNNYSKKADAHDSPTCSQANNNYSSLLKGTTFSGTTANTVNGRVSKSVETRSLNNIFQDVHDACSKNASELLRSPSKDAWNPDTCTRLTKGESKNRDFDSKSSISSLNEDTSFKSNAASQSRSNDTMFELKKHQSCFPYEPLNDNYSHDASKDCFQRFTAKHVNLECVSIKPFPLKSIGDEAISVYSRSELTNIWGIDNHQCLNLLLAENDENRSCSIQFRKRFLDEESSRPPKRRKLDSISPFLS